jgi:hypothetical protein
LHTFDPSRNTFCKNNFDNISIGDLAELLEPITALKDSSHAIINNPTLTSTEIQEAEMCMAEGQTPDYLCSPMMG